MDLPDINLWIALSSQGHVHHERARNYFEGETNGKLAFCKVTALGFHRILCQREAMGDEVRTPAEAWAAYQKWRSQEEVAFIGEPGEVEKLLDTWVAQNIVTTRGWTDAFLAAVAIGLSARLVTFDKGFTRFPGLRLHLLTG